MRRWLCIIIMIAFLVASLGCGGDQKGKKGKELKEPDMSILTKEERNLVASIRRLRVQVKESIRKGAQWLRGKCNDDGSYPGGLGVTSLAMMALMKQPSFKDGFIPRYISDSAEYIARNLNLSAPIRGKTGLWGDVAQKAMAILALIRLNDPRYSDLVRGGLKFLIQAQMDEGEGISPNDPNYGGFGDIYATIFALMAMREGKIAPDDPVWNKAAKFLERCQYYDEVNDQPWASVNSGGFITSPSTSLAGVDDRNRPIPYGSATYAGLLGYLYCGFKPYDMPVRAAFKWVMDNFNFDVNPGLGYKEVGPYYYFMSKSLKSLGNFTVLDSHGVQHRWFNELFSKLKSLQSQDGFWRFESPISDTAFALLALEEGYPRGYPIPGLEFRIKGR
ncbi:terpene cyclase/mutase family protein [Candidatus Poribacteria bacterium]|nr:terpene cyclase/mutase family protein [Candidatus Poribacteria bacterium]